MAAGTLDRALRRLQVIAAAGARTSEEAVQRATVLLLSLLTCAAGALWGLSYWALGLAHVGLVPLAYALIVMFSILAFIATERFEPFAWTQLFLLLVLSGGLALELWPSAIRQARRVLKQTRHALFG